MHDIDDYLGRIKVVQKTQPFKKGCLYYIYLSSDIYLLTDEA